jgi:hypothetical protein
VEAGQVATDAAIRERVHALLTARYQESSVARRALRDSGRSPYELSPVDRHYWALRK